MTPAFDAAMAECARLRLRWEWSASPLLSDPDPPAMSFGNGWYVFHDDDPDDVPRWLHQVLSHRCANTRFKSRP